MHTARRTDCCTRQQLVGEYPSVFGDDHFLVLAVLFQEVDHVLDFAIPDLAFDMFDGPVIEVGGGDLLNVWRTSS